MEVLLFRRFPLSDRTRRDFSKNVICPNIPVLVLYSKLLVQCRGGMFTLPLCSAECTVNCHLKLNRSMIDAVCLR